MPEETSTDTLIERVRAVLPHHQEESTIGALAALCLRLAERVEVLEEAVKNNHRGIDGGDGRA